MCKACLLGLDVSDYLDNYVHNLDYAASYLAEAGNWMKRTAHEEKNPNKHHHLTQIAKKLTNARRELNLIREMLGEL